MDLFVRAGLADSGVRPTRKRGRMPVSADGRVKAVLSVVALAVIASCSVVSAPVESVRAADRFYAALGAEDYESIVRMCSRKMLTETPPGDLISELKVGRNGFGPLLNRQQVSVFTSHFDIHGARGIATSFEYFCEYQNARTIENLRVVEPEAGGPVEVEGYRFKLRVTTASAPG